MRLLTRWFGRGSRSTMSIRSSASSDEARRRAPPPRSGRAGNAGRSRRTHGSPSAATPDGGDRAGEPPATIRCPIDRPTTDGTRRTPPTTPVSAAGSRYSWWACRVSGSAAATGLSSANLPAPTPIIGCSTMSANASCQSATSHLREALRDDADRALWHVGSPRSIRRARSTVSCREPERTRSSTGATSRDHDGTDGEHDDRRRPPAATRPGRRTARPSKNREPRRDGRRTSLPVRRGQRRGRCRHERLQEQRRVRVLIAERSCRADSRSMQCRAMTTRRGSRPQDDRGNGIAACHRRRDEPRDDERDRGDRQASRSARSTNRSTSTAERRIQPARPRARSESAASVR